MSSYRELYRADQLPVFQNRMFPSREAALNCARGDIVLVQDMDTGLIFNQAFQPELMQYDADYQNEQAVSSVFRAHLDDVTEVVRRHFAGDRLIEVGCGKGYFLEHLADQGFDITGLDPTYEGDNPLVIKTYFTPDTGLHADAIILRHVLEHVQDPVAFLERIRVSNGGAGKIYIEVPCFDWICERRAWFDVFYEHVNYFRIQDFRRMFGQVDEAGHLFGGQYMYVVADLATLRKPVMSAADRCDFPADFTATLDRYAAAIGADSRGGLPGSRTVVWGGASKGVIFALYMERAGVAIEHVVDINPAKQGRYLAGTGLRVLSPEQMMADLPDGAKVFVMNGNYLPEIRRMTDNRYSYITVDNENL